MPLEPHALAVLVLTVFAFVLFAREDFAIETSSLLIVTLLAAGFILFPYETPDGPLDPMQFFRGFGNEALVAICALVMASQGLVRTGALAPLGRVVARAWTLSPTLALGVVLVITAVLSAFMNNTPQVALMIPILTSVALKAGTSPSKTLMPMTFASQIGGMGTPIGTSLNLLVISTAAGLGVHRFGMFDFILPASIGASAGLVYLWLVAPRLLPARVQARSDSSARLFNAQIAIPEDSPFAGKKLSEALKKTDGEMAVNAILRAPGISLVPLSETVLNPDDQLQVYDTSDRLREFASVIGGTLYAGEIEVDAEHPLTATDQQIAELVVTQGSRLEGRTLDEVSFDEEFQLVPLALHRASNTQAANEHQGRIKEVRLRVGDVLLVQGPAEQIVRVKRASDVLVLDATSDVPETSKAPLALTIMASIILLATFRIAPIAIAALAGVLAMVFTGCLRWREATRALDRSMILLTVASIGLSYALVQTGGAEFLARVLVDGARHLPPTWVLSGTMLFMAVLANLVSNSAAAVIGTPIAVELARQMGLAPEPFVLAVLFGVNMGFSTPLADNCNLLIYSPGGYKFSDFARVGIPLTLVMWLTLTWALTHYFPLG